MKLNNRITILLIITLNILCYSQFSGGSGTVEDPYQIATAVDLNNIRYYLTSSFIQTADIDLGVAPWNEGSGWDPIGDYDWSNPNLSFRGNFDGDGFKISNIYINKPTESDVGLFGSTDGCVLKNTIISNSNIKGWSYVGSIVGISYNDNITNCTIEGYIEGNATMGLLAGFFEGYNIKNCHAKGEIKSIYGGYIGGITSICNADSVIACSSEVTITESKNVKQGLYAVGGLFGRSVDSDFIENCYSVCNINAKKGDWIGGLIGNYQGNTSISSIKNCYSKGIIYTNPDSSNVGIGGFIGSAYGESMYNSIISMQNCYSLVDVTGNDMVGGFIGRIFERVNIENCYSTGQVTGNTNVGGFIGYIEDPASVTVTNSYWDMETSGIDSSAAGEGRTTAEMTLPVYGSNTYVDWDFVNVWRDDTSNQNNGYPTFLWVSGIEEDEDYVIPEKVKLYQNYPNPFNPVTQIKFDLAKTGNVKLSVYNINGQKVAELLNGVQNAGIHTVEFDGSNLNSGVYYYTLETDGIRHTKKMILTK